MGWSHPNESERADYLHDLREHDEGRALPLRLELTPHSTAMDCALMVRGMNNMVEAGKLVEQYAKTAIARALLDDTLASVGNKQRRRYAVASLIGECEALAASGLLPEQREMTLRKLIADALSSHGMSASDRSAREQIGASA